MIEYGDGIEFPNSFTLSSNEGILQWDPVLEPNKVMSGKKGNGTYVIVNNSTIVNIDYVPAGTAKNTIIFFNEDIKKWEICSASDSQQVYKGTFATPVILESTYPAANQNIGSTADVLSTGTKWFVNTSYVWVDSGSSSDLSSLKIANFLSEFDTQNAKFIAAENIDVYQKNVVNTLLDSKIPKINSPVANQIPLMDANGNLFKSNKVISDFEPTITKNTAFNQNFETSTVNIKMDGIASVGSLNNIPRSDHTHPSDTTKANIDSPSFTGTPTVPTAPVGTNTTQIASTAFVKMEIPTVINSLDVLVFKGIIDASTNPNYPAGDAGHIYRINVAGKIGGPSGINVAEGNLLLCLIDNSPAGNQATVGSNWNISQANIDGAVTTNETTTTDNDFVVFSGTSGKVIKKTTQSVFKTLLNLSKADVGLSNVDNTSDLNKPISTATQNALNGKQDAFGYTVENILNKTSDYTSTSTTQYLNAKGSSDALATTTKNEAIPMVGWLSSNKPTISYNETTRTLTLTKGANNYSFYCNNVKFTKTSNEPVVWGNIEGVHVIYYDGNGVLTDATTSINTIMQSFSTVATFYWSVSQQKIIGGMVNEMHEASVTPAEHLSNHTTFGTRFAGGLVLSANATGTGSLISDIQYSCSTGTLDDDGLQTTLNAKNLTDNFALIYRTGVSGLWQEVSPRTNYIVANGDTGMAVYNQNVSGTWQLTEISNNNYGITYIYAVPAVVVSGVITQFFGVVGQNLYTTLKDAQTAVKNPVNLGNLPFLEYKLIGAFVFQTSSSYTNTGKARIVPADDTGASYVDFRYVLQSGSPASLNANDLTTINNAIATKQDIITLGSSVASKINDTTTIAKTLTGEVITLDVKDNSISTTKLVDSSVTNVKVASNANIEVSKLKQTTVTPVNSVITSGDTQDVINNKTQGQISQNTTNITNLSNNKFDKTGGTISGDVTIQQNLVVNGNLDVNGIVTTIDSTTLQVYDKNIEIGNVATPTDTTADGGGITLKGTNDKLLQWLLLTGAWTSSENIDVISGKNYLINGIALRNVVETLTNKTINGTNNTFQNIPVSSLATQFQSIYYVHGTQGSDTNNGLTPDTAFATIAKACTVIGNAKATVYVLEGTSENVTITNTNVTFTAAGSTQTGVIILSGVINIAHTISSQSFQGFVFDTLNHTGAGSLYLENCQVNTAFTSSGSGYLKAVNTDMSTAAVSITGIGYKDFWSGSNAGTLTINNENVLVSILYSKIQNGVTVTAGICNLIGVAGLINGTNNFFATVAPGATFIASYCVFTNIGDGFPAKVQFTSGSSYSLTGTNINGSTSVISGTNVNAYTTWFSGVAKIASANIDQANITTLSLPNATADRVLVYTGDSVSTSSVTKANLETLLSGGTLNKLSLTTVDGTEAYKILQITDTGNFAKTLPVLNLTTTQRDALTSVPSGYIIYNSTDDKFQTYNGSAWDNIVSAGTGNVSSTGVTGATNKLAFSTNDNMTSLGRPTLSVADRQSALSDLKGLGSYTSTERDTLTWANGDTIFNKTTYAVESYINNSWVQNYRDTTDFISWYANGINGGGTLLGNATWRTDGTSGLRDSVFLTTNTNGQKGFWYKNIPQMAHKRLILKVDYCIGGGSGADGMYYSLFANSAPATSNNAQSQNNSYTIYTDVYNNLITLYYNGTVLQQKNFFGINYGGIDHIKSLEFIVNYDQITQLAKISCRIIGTYGGTGLCIDYQDTVVRNLSGSFLIVEGHTGGLNNFHIIKSLSLQKYYEQ